MSLDFWDLHLAWLRRPPGLVVFIFSIPILILRIDRHGSGAIGDVHSFALFRLTHQVTSFMVSLWFILRFGVSYPLQGPTPYMCFAQLKLPEYPPPLGHSEVMHCDMKTNLQCKK